MIYEHRTYRVGPAQMPEFMTLYNEYVFPVISKYAKLNGAWSTESGTLNSAVFIWGYDSFAHRTKQRAKIAADSEWGPATNKILPFLVHQETFFMNPAPFMDES